MRSTGWQGRDEHPTKPSLEQFSIYESGVADTKEEELAEKEARKVERERKWQEKEKEKQEKQIQRLLKQKEKEQNQKKQQKNGGKKKHVNEQYNREDMRNYCSCCEGFYGDDEEPEEWWQCTKCKDWFHESCTGLFWSFDSVANLRLLQLCGLSNECQSK